MLDLPILHSYSTIQLYKMVGGSKRWPHTIIWEVCGNTLVSEVCFQRLNQDRWRMRWCPSTKSYVAVRSGRDQNGNKIDIYLAREVLGMPHSVGIRFGEADHRNHDTFDNREENLRIATRSQSMTNRRSFRNRISHRFKGIMSVGNTFYAYVCSDNIITRFPCVNLEIEAGLMHYYAAIVVYRDFDLPSVFPEEEMPSEERQEELWQLVLKKLREVGLSN